MSEHRRKPPQPQGGGRAAARRGQPDASSGRRAAPRGATGSPADSYGSGGEEHSYGGRAEARRAAQKGGRRRAPETTGPGGRRGGPGGPAGPGRGRGRATPPPGKKRFIDYPRSDKFGWQRWMPSWKLVTGLFIGFMGSLVAVAGIGYAMVDIPIVAKTAKAQNNVYYWSDGSVMVATGGEINRQIINYADIPKEMRYAVISQENKTFETDSGIDPKGIARAVFNMAKGGQTQGGSTITQQYVKNAMLDDQSQTLSRKFKEIFVSIKVGAEVPKTQIMAGYLNSAYFGRGAYGLEAASRAYFNKDADQLNPGECAFLSAMLKGATYYDPAGATSLDPTGATPEANKKRALSQMQDTLDKMVEYGHLSPTERAKYRTLPKWQNPRSNSRLGGQIGYLVDLAKSYLINNSDKTKVTEEKLQKGGYRIYTTFDKTKVKELESAVKKVQKGNIKPKQRPETDTHVQFGGASVDPATGAIKAIYGGEDATKHFTNNADSTGAQVGSTFKPFVLAAAMKWGVKNPDLGDDQAQDERTQVSPKSLYSGKNKLKIKNYDGSVWTDKDGKEWLQTNDGNESVNPPTYKIDLREAMRLSVNSAYVQLGMDVGLDKVKETALDAGVLKGSLASANYPSFSIGTSDPSAIRMAGAYATFAASGEQNPPYSVSKVEDKDGQVYKHRAETHEAFTSAVADNVTDVLKTVVDKGTGTSAQLPGRPVAGKTGTTDGNKSAWFVGYTPQLSTAISMFRLDDNANNKKRTFLEMYGTGGQEKIHGASFPAEIWHDYMAQALKNAPVKPFPTPVPIGKVINAEPSPTPTPSVTETEETSPTPTPTPTQSSPSPTPSASDTCGFFGCNNNGGNGNGGNGNGGADGGTDGGTTPTPTITESTGTGNTRGNGNGGFFGGQNG
ncbi:transglycosylase domain-containing protein [Streptomyces sp. 900105245]|uniref:transglycosylase domain-containing protein n=1 Tax=Streptomyces sp. 900105245 TaxID=3154379 RepID=UPI00333475F0